ncbi:MAG: hypothetical protein Kow0077_04530 [Anaerolineae bacterium]
MLYQADTDMLFPPRVIPSLADLRGPEWKSLVDHVASLPHHHPELLGFMLMMVRIDGCLSCQADSYRAMRGCTLCARQAIARFKGEDSELVALWQSSVNEIKHWMATNVQPAIK